MTPDSCRGSFHCRAVPGAKLSYMLLVGSRVKHMWSGRGGGPAFFYRELRQSNCRSVAARRGDPCGRPGFGRLRWGGRCRNKKQGRKNPTQHSYHITARSLRQWQNRPPSGKSVFSTKANVRIWGTFRLEKFGFPCYLIVTKRNRKNTDSSGGLPKVNRKYGNQSDFTSK